MLLNHLLSALTALTTVNALSAQLPFKEHSNTISTFHTHTSFPKHSLTIQHHGATIPTDFEERIHKDATLQDVCPGVKGAYTGYLNVGEKHFFFAYFESLSKPEADPLVMWINGGPGCSSMTGLFMELGPCRVTKGGDAAVKNPDSWINNANVFFLDQPIGVGFSYSTNHSIHANGTFAASEDIYAFMQLWYEAFPPSRKLPFSIAGESYGGHYIPIFAQHIQEMNQISPSDKQIPLESVLIGNGIFSETAQTSSYYDIPCTNVTGIGPLFNATVCDRMASSVPRCEYLLEACHAYPDPLICDAGANFCGLSLQQPYVDSGLNYYDISKPCVGPLCYPIVDSIDKYLRMDTVRKAFGIPKEAPKFEGCSNAVGRDFERVHDGLIDTREFVVKLLHGGVRVLIYVGTYDWICNFVGNERVFGSLAWSGLADFRYQQENNKQVWSGGLWWESGNLRYARVNGAGHMVPYDKPKEALHMFKTWLNRKPLV